MAPPRKLEVGLGPDQTPRLGVNQGQAGQERVARLAGVLAAAVVLVLVAEVVLLAEGLVAVEHHVGKWLDAAGPGVAGPLARPLVVALSLAVWHASEIRR